MDIRRAYDSKYLGSWDFIDDQGRRREACVAIKAVRVETIIGQKGRKDTKPIIQVDGFSLPMVLNKTNAKTIIGLYGPESDAWIGKKITIYVDRTDMQDRKNVECLRVKAPRSTKSNPPPPPKVDDDGVLLDDPEAENYHAEA